MNHPTIICLTPVRNEAWILERFLKCASLWADYIIIADQHSDDGSREIAQRFEKVILIDNSSQQYSESDRQKLLIEEARKISGPRLLITLDADEFLTANFMDSAEWLTVLNAPTGTVVKFQWANIRPDMATYWMPSAEFAWGFIDDGSEHVGTKIHSPRIPTPENANSISLRDIRVLHYQYTDWERMKSKHRWYQCWERINHPERHAIDIYRQYHHMYAIPLNEIKVIPDDWKSEYERQGIDMTSTYRTEKFRWDEEVLDLIQKYGALKFKREAIWDVDWSVLSELTGSNSVRDPRSNLDRYIHRWLERTQLYQEKLTVKAIAKILRLLGW
jgi:glycosyltransferase involved in cell wall biosynthesis